jgi:hypothetical protein
MIVRRCSYIVMDVPITLAFVHAAAGAIGGGFGAAITGGDIGQGMLTGGISGGLGTFAGGYMKDWGFGAQLIGRSIVGGISGGIAATMYGGDFGEGFKQGAVTAGFATIFNDFNHSYDENGQKVVDNRDRPYGSTNKELWAAGGALSAGVAAVVAGPVVIPAAIVAGTAVVRSLTTMYLSNPNKAINFVIDAVNGYAPGYPRPTVGGLAGYTTSEVQKALNK